MLPEPRRVPPVTTARRRVQDAAMRLFAERGVTQVTVSELAEAAGVARGTVYNQGVDVDALFEQVATDLTAEMTTRIDATLARTRDPAERLALGIRLFVRRASEEPVWGRFVSRFSASSPTLRALMLGGPARDLASGVGAGRLKLRPDQQTAAIAMMSGSVLASILAVLEGHATWRDAGSTAAELFLRALGIAPAEARAISVRALPALANEPPPVRKTRSPVKG